MRAPLFRQEDVCQIPPHIFIGVVEYNDLQPLARRCNLFSQKLEHFADSDHVFVNIWAEPKGHAWTYQAAYDLVLRLRARTGIAFDPHWFRHSAATRWLRDGVPIEVVSTLLGHSSVTVTSSVYGHLTAEDARAALEKAGWFTGKEVQW